MSLSKNLELSSRKQRIAIVDYTSRPRELTVIYKEHEDAYHQEAIEEITRLAAISQVSVSINQVNARTDTVIFLENGLLLPLEISLPCLVKGIALVEYRYLEASERAGSFLGTQPYAYNRYFRRNERIFNNINVVFALQCPKLRSCLDLTIKLGGGRCTTWTSIAELPHGQRRSEIIRSITHVVTDNQSGETLENIREIRRLSQIKIVHHCFFRNSC